VHRDLKLDNTLLSGHNPPYIKLCDFGFARNWDAGEESNMSTVIGRACIYSLGFGLHSVELASDYQGSIQDVYGVARVRTYTLGTHIHTQHTLGAQTTTNMHAHTCTHTHAHTHTHTYAYMHTHTHTHTLKHTYTCRNTRLHVTSADGCQDR